MNANERESEPGMEPPRTPRTPRGLGSESGNEPTVNAIERDPIEIPMSKLEYQMSNTKYQMSNQCQMTNDRSRTARRLAFDIESLICHLSFVIRLSLGSASDLGLRT